MDTIISQLENLKLEDSPPPPLRTANRQMVWTTLKSLYIENKRLKEYITYILERTPAKQDCIPEWVY